MLNQKTTPMYNTLEIRILSIISNRVYRHIPNHVVKDIWGWKCFLRQIDRRLFEYGTQNTNKIIGKLL